MILQRLKSKTYRLGIFVGVLGIAEANFHMIAQHFGDKAGLVNLLIMVAIFIARESTDKALSEK